jgi:hypothetical protein
LQHLKKIPIVHVKGSNNQIGVLSKENVLAGGKHSPPLKLNGRSPVKYVQTRPSSECRMVNMLTSGRRFDPRSVQSNDNTIIVSSIQSVTQNKRKTPRRDCIGVEITSFFKSELFWARLFKTVDKVINRVNHLSGGQLSTGYILLFKSCPLAKHALSWIDFVQFNLVRIKFYPEDKYCHQGKLV